MSFKITENDNDNGYRFRLMNSKIFLATTENCHLKFELTEGDYRLRHCKSLTKKKNITDVLKIKTNADDREDQKDHQLQIIPYISR